MAIISIEKSSSLDKHYLNNKKIKLKIISNRILPVNYK